MTTLQPRKRNSRVSPSNNLAATHPQLANQWHPTKNGSLLPTEVTPYNQKKVAWLCPNGLTQPHEWMANISNRTRWPGCPFCSGKRTSTDNNLTKTHPHLASQWHTIQNKNKKPTDVVAGSNFIATWVCPKSEDHIWQASVSSRAWNGQDGCPFCLGKRVCPSNSLKTKFPEIAKQWHPTRNGRKTPLDFTAKSQHKAFWICSSNHEWEASVKTRTNGHGCSRCFQGTSMPELFIHSQHLALAQDAVNGMKIGKISIDSYSDQYKEAIEVDGYPWHIDRSADKRKTQALAVLGISLIRIRDGRLPMISADDVMMDLQKFKPDKPTSQRIIQAIIDSRQKRRIDTPSSATLFVGDNIPNIDIFHKILNDWKRRLPKQPLSFTHPAIASDWDFSRNGDLTPQNVTAGNRKKIYWKCTKDGTEWAAVIQKRTSEKSRCPTCFPHFNKFSK